ncbi:hypothetical protein [Thalassotalea crassostreae]|uniref:hypothetical protein n=1 Tax=Thalassotalea crassostreae TaxID=1763536 RepID=UPI0008384509|nr:hypothetical protein [Thalassotalea crassostreae]
MLFRTHRLQAATKISLLFLCVLCNAIIGNAYANEVNGVDSASSEDKLVNVQLTQQDVDALKLGQKLQQAMQAINLPNDPASIHKITALGWDQRYYVMIRGWLVLQLQADQSAYTGSQSQQLLGDRIEFLKLAIRTIDLE